MNTKTLDFYKTFQFDLRMGLDEDQWLETKSFSDGMSDYENEDVIYIMACVDDDGTTHYDITPSHEVLSKRVLFGPDQICWQYSYENGAWVRKDFDKVYLFLTVEGEGSDGQV